MFGAQFPDPILSVVSVSTRALINAGDFATGTTRIKREKARNQSDLPIEQTFRFCRDLR